MASFGHEVNVNRQAVSQLDQAEPCNGNAPITTLPIHDLQASANATGPAHSMVLNGIKNASSNSQSHSRGNSSGELRTDVCNKTRKKWYLAKAEHVLSKRFFGQNMRRKTIECGKSQSTQIPKDPHLAHGCSSADFDAQPEKITGRQSETTCSSRNSDRLNSDSLANIPAESAQAMDRSVGSDKANSSEVQLSAATAQGISTTLSNNHEHDGSDIFFGVDFQYSHPHRATSSENLDDDAYYLSGQAGDPDSQAVLSNYEFTPPEEAFDAMNGVSLNSLGNHEYGTVHLLPVSLPELDNQSQNRPHFQRPRGRATTKARSTEDLATLLRSCSSQMTASNAQSGRNPNNECASNDTYSNSL